MYVYVIVNSETLKIYIGQHKGSDLRKYLAKKWFDSRRYVKGVSHLFNAMRKYPQESWSIHPLISGIEDKQELDETERHYIRVLKTQHPEVGYNICSGGEGRNGPHTAEWKQQMSDRLKGHITSEETKAKIRASNIGLKLGQHLTEDTKKKMSLSHKQYIASGGKTTPGMQGRQHSIATLAKMRTAAAGRIITPDAKEKMRVAKLGKPWSAARRAAQNKTFSSISEELASV